MLHFRLRTPRHFQEIRSNNTLDKRDDGDNQMKEKEKEKDDDIVHPGNPKKTLILAQFSNSPWTPRPLLVDAVAARSGDVPARHKPSPCPLL